MSDEVNSTLLEVRELNHWFGDKQVLKDLNFDVKLGSICVIMGSSGGGKTTLLKVISGLLAPSNGTVLIGKNSVYSNGRESNILTGLVFQYAALFDSLNVKDNILFGLRRKKKLTALQEDEILDKMLSQVGLSGVENLLPSELSGGMRKRVGLARALCMAPEVLLYDEPTSGLDPVTAYSIDRLIVDTRDQTGVTSLVVSHDVTSVFRVADQIIFLHQGEIAFDGNPDAFRKADIPEINELVLKANAESL